jgi:hypothetical protein
MSKRQSVYFNDTVLATLNKRHPNISLSAQINRLIDRYAEIMRRHRYVIDDFTDQETQILFDTIKTWPAEPASSIAGWLTLEIEGAIHLQSEEKKSISDKLKKLSFAEEVALVAALEEMWKVYCQPLPENA